MIPLLALLWLAYNAMLLVGASSVLERVVSSLTLPSGAVWTMRGGDVLVALGLFALYVEMLKSTRTGTSSVIEHSLSVLAFVLFLVEFIVSIFAARRDLAIDRTVE